MRRGAFRLGDARVVVRVAGTAWQRGRGAAARREAKTSIPLRLCVAGRV